MKNYINGGLYGVQTVHLTGKESNFLIEDLYIIKKMMNK